MGERKRLKAVPWKNVYHARTHTQANISSYSLIFLAYIDLRIVSHSLPLVDNREKLVKEIGWRKVKAVTQ